MQGQQPEQRAFQIGDVVHITDDNLQRIPADHSFLVTSTGKSNLNVAEITVEDDIETAGIPGTITADEVKEVIEHWDENRMIQALARNPFFSDLGVEGLRKSIEKSRQKRVAKTQPKTKK